jgi:hypothetical protein
MLNKTYYLVGLAFLLYSTPNVGISQSERDTAEAKNHSVWEKTKAGTEKGWEKTKEGTKVGWEKTKEGTNTAWHEGKKGVKKGVNWTKKAGKKGWNKTKKVGSAIGTGLKDDDEKPVEEKKNP